MPALVEAPSVGPFFFFFFHLGDVSPCDIFLPHLEDYHEQGNFAMTLSYFILKI